MMEEGIGGEQMAGPVAEAVRLATASVEIDRELGAVSPDDLLEAAVHAYGQYDALRLAAMHLPDDAPESIERDQLRAVYDRLIGLLPSDYQTHPIDAYESRTSTSA